MPSDTAKKAAGTYIADSISALPTVLAWITQECRSGNLSEHVDRFCNKQQERPEPSLVIVEAINNDCLQCKIPCRCYDHESSSTFDTEIRFDLNPQTGACQRR